MVDKKTPNKPKVSKPKVKESKVDSFIRIATPRVKNVLKTLRILGNCSNRNNYEYSEVQIEKISMSLTGALVDIMKKFTKSKKEVESFEL